MVRGISAKKHEPEWMLDFRLKAFRKWLTMAEPAWSDNDYPTINYQVGVRDGFELERKRIHTVFGSCKWLQLFCSVKPPVKASAWL